MSGLSWTGIQDGLKELGMSLLLDNVILLCMYSCKIIIRISALRIKFNCILKWTSIAIMMRDGGNTLHSCLINSCCVLKVDDIT